MDQRVAVRDGPLLRSASYHSRASFDRLLSEKLAHGTIGLQLMTGGGLPMFITRAALFFSALVSAAFPAFSQPYPTRPVTMIVPFAVGGPTDTIARIMGERMGKTLGQQV